jgi:hypothetical protein
MVDHKQVKKRYQRTEKSFIVPVSDGTLTFNQYVVSCVGYTSTFNLADDFTLPFQISDLSGAMFSGMAICAIASLPTSEIAAAILPISPPKRRYGELG